MKRIIQSLLIGTLICGVCLAEIGSATVTVEDASDNCKENVRLAIDAIDGIELEYGDEFSFNDLVGPRTESAGFKSAVNGRGVNVTGGGVARVASAIYMAIRDSGVDVDYKDRYTYGSRYEEAYVEDASDAILVDYASDIDFSFICKEDSIVIDLDMDDGNIVCTVDVTEDEPAYDVYYDAEESEVMAADMLPEIRFDSVPAGASIFTIASAAIDMPGINTGEYTNIEIAANSIDHSILAPGDVFSFNAAVGPREQKYGFVNGMNGRGAQVTGGGVAQVASVLWLAIKNVDDISIVKRSTYGKKYNQSYVDDANDAILTDYNGNVDFAFRNDSGDELTIRVNVDGDTLVCEITK